MKPTGAKSIFKAVEMVASSHPDAPAVLALHRQGLDYAGLMRQCEKVIAHLDRSGITNGDRILAVLPNGPELAVAFLAVAARATFVPVNLDCPSQAYMELFQRLKPSVVWLTETSPRAAWDAASHLRLPVMELIWEHTDPAGVFELRLLTPGTARHMATVRTEDVALILATSGTMASPQLVPMTHANILASAVHNGAALQLSAQDVSLNISPMHHTLGLLIATLLPWLFGGSVACMPNFDAGKFFAQIAGFDPTWITATPTAWHDAMAEARCRHHRFQGGRLRFVRAGAAALPAGLRSDLERFFGVPVIEAYGCTEAAPQIATQRLPPQLTKPGSVGWAVGPEIAIMDELGRGQAPGIPGEIAIRGANVVAGYWDAPEANRSSFRAGWFFTGDYGYLDGDGFLFITGRLKEIINRGGEKIAPREVEETLLRHPSVERAVAFGIPDSRLGEVVGAAVVLRQGAGLAGHELLRFTAQLLPAFKAPQRVFLVRDIPTGSTGKYRRQELAKLFGSEMQACGQNSVWLAPAEGMEADLAAIWREVLQCDRVGRSDHFISLGGDSMAALKIAFAIQERLGVEVSMAALFQAPSVAELAQYVRTQSERK